MTGDKTNKTLTTLAVLVVAIIAAVISFVHIEHLAVTHGQTLLAALLLPVSIDGTVAAASLVMLRAARAGLTTPWLARVMLGLSVLATLLSNVAYGEHYGLTGALLSGWPAVAFIGCAEMAIGMIRRARQAEPEPSLETVAEVVPEAVSANAPVASGTAVEAAPETAPHPVSAPVPASTAEKVASVTDPTVPGASVGTAAPKRAPRRRNTATPRRAETAFADVLADGQVPSLRQIKAKLHCGADKAKELRDHLRGVVDGRAVAEEAAA